MRVREWKEIRLMDLGVVLQVSIVSVGLSVSFVCDGGE
jgi:hypothetical protein